MLKNKNFDREKLKNKVGNQLQKQRKSGGKRMKKKSKGKRMRSKEFQVALFFVLNLKQNKFFKIENEKE